jgi:soluble lytic murein transglycosylase
MQLMPATAKWAAERLNVDGFAEKQMENPSLNIKLGVWYLGNLRSTLGSNLLHVIPAYNAGPGNLKRWLDQLSTDDVDLYVESIPIGETRDYVKKVLSSYGAYLTLYGDG